MAHLAGPAAGGAGLGLGANFRARARAGFTGDRRGDAHLRGLAHIGFLERDLHVVAQICAALAAPAAATSPSPAHAEQIFENIREARGEVRAKAMRTARPALLEGRMAEPVVGRALLIVLQDVVGFVDLFELMLAVLVAGIAIRVPLHRKLAVGSLEIASVDGALDFKNFVVIPLRHQVGVPQ